MRASNKLDLTQYALPQIAYYLSLKSGDIEKSVQNNSVNSIALYAGVLSSIVGSIAAAYLVAVGVSETSFLPFILVFILTLGLAVLVVKQVKRDLMIQYPDRCIGRLVVDLKQHFNPQDTTLLAAVVELEVAQRHLNAGWMQKALQERISEGDGDYRYVASMLAREPASWRRVVRKIYDLHSQRTNELIKEQSSS